MAVLEKANNFRVIIAGGGIAGLTLANALQHADIDYVLLEARGLVAPQVGASIGLFPHGIRILDQLDCYDEIAEQTCPITSGGDHDVSGNYICPRSDMPKLGVQRYEQVLQQVAAERLILQDMHMMYAFLIARTSFRCSTTTLTTRAEFS